MTLLVLRAGPSALIQDLGRPGYADLGVTRSGAADRGAAALANRAVGNQADAAVLELLFGGLTVSTDADCVLCATGAPVVVTLEAPDGRVRTAHSGEVLVMPAGWTAEVGRPARGLRTYVAVRGGVDAAPVLGSRSRDTLAGLGPAPLRIGDALRVGAAVAGPWSFGWAASAVDAAVVDAVVDLRLYPGPRDDLFPVDAWDVLARPARVSAHSDRIGVRLEPERPVPRLPRGELPSEGMVRGSVQVPADGHPVLFGPDHPVTGGYPVIGVLTPDSADRAAQLLPGETVRLLRTPNRR